MRGTIIKIALVALPLSHAFFYRDCARQQKSGGGQPVEVSQKMSTARTGTWGGEHISLEVTADGAQVEYDCGHGTVDEKIVGDSQGRFTLRGTHVREHGGPVRKDEKADSHPARFAGQIKGDAMTLTVTETDTNETVGTFTLAYGQQPRLMKCR
jgi:hypothetical protein